jgi:hypothetical protein
VESKRFDEERKAWADGHMPLVVEAIKPVIHRLITIETAPFFDDVMGVDVFITLPRNWAIRVRRAKYWYKYGDLTFRITPNGNELDKVLTSADYLFYGWLNDDESSLLGWVIVEISRLKDAVYGMITGIYTVPGGNALCSVPLKAVFQVGAIAAMSESVAQRLSKVL